EPTAKVPSELPSGPSLVTLSLPPLATQASPWPSMAMPQGARPTAYVPRALPLESSLVTLLLPPLPTQTLPWPSMATPKRTEPSAKVPSTGPVGTYTVSTRGCGQTVERPLTATVVV